MLTIFPMIVAKICKDDLTGEVGTGSSYQDLFGAEAIRERISSILQIHKNDVVRNIEESSDRE